MSERRPTGPSELHHLHDDLQLLSLQLAPPLAIRLQKSFIELCLSLGPAGWAGFGFQVARQMLRWLGPGHVRSTLCGASPAEIKSYAELLEACLDVALPELPGKADWQRDAGEAIRSIERAHEDLDHFMRTGDAQEDFGRWWSGEYSILVPVVSRVPNAPRRHPLFANASVTHGVFVSVSARPVLQRAEEPSLIVTGATMESRAETEKRILQSVRLLRPRGAPAATHLLLEAHWNEPRARICGRSADLGLVLGALGAWRSLVPGWTHSSVAQGVAATGGVDGHQVLAVEESTFGEKVRACFFSPSGTLCVPDAQIDRARAELEVLQQAYPERTLDIRPVGDIRLLLRARNASEGRDLFVSRRRKSLEGLRSLLGWFFWSRARIVLLLTAAVLSVALAGFVAEWTKDVPATAAWDGDAVVLRNPHDWVIERIPVRNPGRKHGPGTSFLELADVCGDARLEAIVIHANAANRVAFISAFSHNGKELWRRRAFGHEDDPWRAHTSLMWFSLHGVLADVPGEAGILATRRDTQDSLCLVDVLSGETGHLLGQLANYGHIDRLAFIDIDGDSYEEHIALGGDDVADMALAVVLDERALFRQAESGALDAAVPSLTRANSSRLLPAALGGLPPVPGPMMTDPRSLDWGVLSAVRFPKDAYNLSDGMPRCVMVESESAGEVMIGVQGGSTPMQAVLYPLTVLGAEEILAKRPRFNDAYIDLIRADTTKAVPEEAIGREEMRLRGLVEVLTRDGWRTAQVME